jgi:hypothetical protein
MKQLAPTQVQETRQDDGHRHSGGGEAGFADRRASTALQAKMSALANNGPRAVAQRALSERIQAGPAMTVQRQAAPARNDTGLPDQLKSGVESLSGLSMDHVKVHYNSAQPAQLNAHAYAQGSDIHVGPGQEQHLPHEAWHVAQQMQGRVQPTAQLQDGTSLNDNAGLEAEATQMGEKALQAKSAPDHAPALPAFMAAHNMAAQRMAIVQAAWVEETGERGAVHAWDALMDGVRWFADNAGRMWYRIVEEGAMDYSGLEGQVKSFETWHQLRMQNDPTHRLPFMEYEKVCNSPEDNAIVMNEILAEANSYVGGLRSLTGNVPALAASCVNIMEVLNDKARKKMEGVGATLKDGRARLVLAELEKVIGKLVASEDPGVRKSLLGDIYGWSIANQNFSESNNRGTYILTAILSGIFEVPIPTVDVALSREKVAFMPKKIKAQFMEMPIHQ